MIDVLEFIFQDFWHWIGTLILLSVAIPHGCLIRINTGRKNKEEEKK